jgi:hypothetical protein
MVNLDLPVKYFHMAHVVIKVNRVQQVKLDDLVFLGCPVMMHHTH